ncbi:hypothetical protein [Actinotalea sp. K2]|uniref:hypothetical protein n=1 Tax=Actinotalea sp. K2 TaxID=2939438 RepID=UPI0020171203|nr:hypothetical protein [Actinotalea sp. K2]MCL3862089.1 hypothetical protein [Actinotalea sp. K2]
MKSYVKSTKGSIVAGALATTLLLAGGGYALHAHNVTVAQERIAAQEAELVERARAAAAQAREDAAVEVATDAADYADAHLALTAPKLDSDTLATYTAAIAALREAVTTRDLDAMTIATSAVTAATTTADGAVVVFDTAQAAAEQAAAEASAAAAEQAAAEQAAAAAPRSGGTASQPSGQVPAATPRANSGSQSAPSGGTPPAPAPAPAPAPEPPSGDVYWECGKQPNGDYIRCGPDPVPPPPVQAPAPHPYAGQCIDYGSYTKCYPA